MMLSQLILSPCHKDMYQMTRKIVSGVTKYTEKNDDGDIVDCLKVHYTDGTSKDFTVAEWEFSFNEGRRLWQQHEKDFNGQ